LANVVNTEEQPCLKQNTSNYFIQWSVYRFVE